MKLIPHLIAGSLLAGTETSPVFNPATGEQSGSVASGGKSEIDAAVTAAQAAFPGWAATTPSKRAKVMYEMRRLLGARGDEIARAISAEHGKMHADALGEVARGQEVVEFACGIPHLLKGSFSPSVSAGMDSYDQRQPLGENEKGSRSAAPGLGLLIQLHAGRRRHTVAGGEGHGHRRRLGWPNWARTRPSSSSWRRSIRCGCG